MTDHPTMKLGKRPPRLDPRTLQLERYLRLSQLPKPPARLAVPSMPGGWPTYGNDRYGDCVEADMAHQTQLWTQEAGSEVMMTLDDVLGVYSAVAGFDPANPATDQGTVWLDALNYWRQTGIGGHKISGYVAIKPTAAQIRIAAWLFGGVQLGIAMPISAQAQTAAGLWSVTRGPDAVPGSWGGHAVPVVGYDSRYVTVVTWGRLVRATWGYLARYCDEAYVALSPEWISQATQRSPQGFDTATLQADLSQFA